MRNKSFNFRWKLVENYTAAAIGGIFLWFFIQGTVNLDNTSLMIAILMLAVAPFLITYIDRKSSQ